MAEGEWDAPYLRRLIHLNPSMDDSRPKTVQIFLPDGNAQSVRIAQITSRTIEAIQIPRQKLEVAGEREEVHRVGVYFLFGDVGDDAAKPPAYIGEAENCLQRIKGHHQQKDFWTTAVVITSKTRSFTKAHARRLEYDSIQAAQDAQRFRLQNSRMPDKPHIPEPTLAELRDNFGTIQTLLSILGFPVLDPLPTEEESTNGQSKLFCRGAGVEASGRYTEDGLVVFEGSEARLDTTTSAPDSLKQRRRKLSDDGVLVQQGDRLVFQENHPFNSPSAAAGVVLGRSSNGWKEWRDADGQSLDSLERL